MDSPVEIMDSEPSKPSLLLKRSLPENVKPTRFPQSTSIDLFQRPLSELARHRIHELSDIREVSGSSKAGTMNTTPSAQFDGPRERVPSTPPRLQEPSRNESPLSDYATPRNRQEVSATPPRGLGSRAASAMSVPLREVPERRSSASVIAQSVAGSRQNSVTDFPSWKLPTPAAAGTAIPSRGRAESPVRRALKKDAVSSDVLRSSPSRTFIRTTPPLEILDHGQSRHGRIDMGVRLPSPLFVGGGTIEGQIQLVVDGGTERKSSLKPILISKLSIDVIGVEEINDGRRWIFLSLAAELFDENHPPPASLVSSQLPVESAELFWPLKPASATIPFCMNLPLNLGPPPYLSRRANIRYLLCPTVVIKAGGKKSVIRQTWNIQMVTVHDPEKALASLPSPLLAADTLTLAQGSESHNVKLTAGLHRQTWVNGGMIFVDVHIANNSAKWVKKIEVQLEKTVLWYAHAAAGTAEKSASHLRLPRKSDSEVIRSNTIKKSKEWSGVLPFSSEVRTCELSVPRGHVTISTGRYFEVRYFLNVIVSLSRLKVVTVQLPVTIIHMNSLDILPNSLAQVAASIEAKRSRTVPVSQDIPLYAHYHQGQAFAAPRRQSIERARLGDSGLFNDDVGSLAADLDNSPRRYARHAHSHGRMSTLSTGFSSEIDAPSRFTGVPSSHHHHIRHPSCYHCHLAFNDHARSASIAPPHGPKLPRLQISTSGLGFSDSEFEVSPDSPPRKVMLSESERKMINQQRELKVQRQWSQKSRRRSHSVGDGDKERVEGPQDGYWGWKNVAAGPNAGPKLPDYGNRSQFAPLQGRTSQRREGERKKDPAPTRTRSRTNPERLVTIPGPSKHRRGPKSMDRISRLAISIDGTSAGMMPPRTSRDLDVRTNMNTIRC